MESELQTRTAYHEAGHAVLAVLQGAEIESLSIELDWEDAGRERFGATRVRWPDDAWSEREVAIREVKIALAGPVAEMIYDGNQYEPEMLHAWQEDWDMAVERAGDYLPKSQSLAEYLSRITYELIRFFERSDVWATVAALADQLEAHEALGAEEVAVVMEAWPIV
tara:strand:- start:4564 stop:5061 length:498 start_codon:yes stop_codon:yes gene_type:complete